MRRLGGRMDRQLLGRWRVVDDQSSTFQRNCCLGVLVDFVGEYVRRVGEDFLQSRARWSAHLADQIGAVTGVDEVFGGHSRLVVDHGDEGLIVHVHLFGTVLGHVAALGHDERYRIAHVADAFAGQRRPRCLGTGGTDRRVPLFASARVEVGSREHCVHPGHGHRGRSVDGPHAGTGEWAANEARMEHLRQRDVVHVTAPASQQSDIFHPGHPHPAISGGRDLGAIYHDALLQP